MFEAYLMSVLRDGRRKPTSFLGCPDFDTDPVHLSWLGNLGNLAGRMLKKIRLPSPRQTLLGAQESHTPFGMLKKKKKQTVS